MKNNDLFNKIIKQEPEEVKSENNQAAEKEENAAEAIAPKSEKPQMPPVKPSTIVIMVLFCMIVGLAYFFLPYLTQYLPFGTTINKELEIQPVGYSYLINNCHSVVIGKSVDSYVDAGDLNPELYYTVHKFEVEQVLFGEPFMSDDKHLDTYTLGGTVTIQDYYGRPKRVTYTYNNSAELGNDRVLLFLDDNNNIINEKYGV